ncbi:FecR family protein [Terricaulis sp.]|uniref:FecR family protein n=1 Tax=Terricaulis sp. TaxID=2768686 RepID=UPI002AC445F3|nr:FecR family protein [Terricaulis sp.]MDZ4690314.1 FecR family protein [Terricaulis sp.]
MRFFLFALAFVSVGIGAASAQEWRALEVAGVVRVMEPGQTARAVNARDVLPAGAIVTTGRDSRAVFSNGAARASLSANSRLTLASSENGLTRFVQDVGTALFQVDRRRDPHFEVRTSLLAAVVKGTTFTVTVEPDQHRVFVAEGTVEVSPAEGGEAELVSNGAMAEVARAHPGRVERPQMPAQQGAVIAPALNYAALTGGIIRNGDAAPLQDAEGEPGHFDASADTSQPSEQATLATDHSGDADTSGDADVIDSDGQGDAGGDTDEDVDQVDADTGDAGDTEPSDPVGDDTDVVSEGDDGAATDDDGNNGHGNDDDGDDDSNPGRGGGGGRFGGDDDDNNHTRDGFG